MLLNVVILFLVIPCEKTLLYFLILQYKRETIVKYIIQQRFNMTDCRPFYIDQSPSDASETPITVLVINSVDPMPDKHYETFVAYRGILMGALKRLQFTTDFKFTFMEFQDYGPYLNSVNGLFEDRGRQTYWQLEVRKPDGSVIVPDVGIGCYIPDKDDEIILNYNFY